MKPVRLASVLLLLLIPGLPAGAQGTLDELLGGCGVTMSCPAPGGPASPAQCVNNDVGNPCGVQGGPATQAAPGGQSVGAGNPISVLSGNKYQREADLPALPGVLGLEVVRHYNSRLGHTERRGIHLGPGWRLSYDTRLYSTRHNLQILQADGSRIIFARNPAEPDRCASLDPARGQVLISRKAHGEQYVWHWPDGRRLFFDGHGLLTQILAPSGEFVALQRDPAGRLVSVTDPQGRTLRVGYTDDLRTIAHIDTPLGRIAYTYDEAGKLTKVTLPTGYDPATQPHPYAGRGTTTSTLAREYHYEDEHSPALLTGITVSGSGTDGELVHQRIASWAYDQEARAIRSVRGPMPPPGERGAEDLTLDFSTPGRTVLTNSLGQTSTYITELIGSERRIIEARGPGCATCPPTNVRYRYDAAARPLLTTTLDDDGHPLQSTRTEFDAHGRRLHVEGYRFISGRPELQGWVRYAYGPGTLTTPVLIARPSVVPGKEHQIRIDYNEAGQPLRVTETGFSPLDENGEPARTPEAATAIERTTTYAYARINGRSVLTEIDGPLPNGPQASPEDSDITRFEWDELGHHPVLRTEPGGRQTRLARDPAGRVDTSTFTDGIRQISRTVRLDTRGAVLQASVTASATNMAPLAREYAFSYDALGRLVSARGPDGITTSIEHAADGTTTTLTPDGKLVDLHDRERRLLARAVYDAHGELAWAQMNLRDEHNRLVARVDADGVMQAYGLAPQSGEGRVSFAPDGAAVLQGTDAAGLHQLAADGGMRTLSLRDGAWMLRDAAGRGHVLLKDDFGRTVIELAPDEGRLLYAYSGATVEKRQFGLQGEQSVETLRFDHAGRLIERHRAGCTESLHYQGDLLERLQGCANAHVFARDAFGQITLHEQYIEADTGTLRFASRYAYAATDGRLLARSLPDGQRLHYHYDPHTAHAQHIARERGWLNAARRLSDGFADWLHALLPQALTEQTLLADIAHPPLGHALSYRHGNGMHTKVTAGTNGRIQSIAVAPSDGPALIELRQTRDHAGRITATELGGTTTAFAYDAAGRLAEARLDGRDGALLHTAYTPLGERRSQQAVSRDGFGRQSALGTLHLTYDEAHRLTEVHREQRMIARYTYDTLGNRISKTVDGRTTFFIYDLQHRLVAEADAHGRLHTQYLYAGHRPHTLLRADDGEQARDVFAIHADPRGLALAVTDEHANIVWQQAFGPFGEPLAATAVDMPAFHYPLRLAGQYDDAETGLHYNIHRYYDPRSGRYITPDPLGLSDSDNRYAYVRNAPLGAVDPLGLFPIDEDFFWTSRQSRPLKLTDQGGHLDILMIAFTQYQMDNGYRFSPTIIDQIVRNNYHTDSQGSPFNLGGGQGNIYNHWDNPNNGPMCQDMHCNTLMPHYGTTDWIAPALAQISGLRDNYASVGGATSAMTTYNIRSILSSFGQNTHAIADFYAHTNWVDGFGRGGAVCNDLGTNGFLGTPPVRPDRLYVLEDPSDPFSHNYHVFEVGYVPTGLNQHTLWDETLVEGLFSGTVNLTAEPVGCPLIQHGKPGDIECHIDPTTHGYWHKDDDAGPGGSAPYSGLPMFGWEVKEYEGEPPERNNVKLTFGTEWYADLGVTQADLKIGDRIYVQVEIKDKYQLAFQLAIDHTKQEIARLYDAAGGVMVGVTPLREVYKMDAGELSSARIGYLGMNSKQ